VLMKSILMVTAVAVKSNTYEYMWCGLKIVCSLQTSGWSDCQWSMLRGKASWELFGWWGQSPHEWSYAFLLGMGWLSPFWLLFSRPLMHICPSAFHQVLTQRKALVRCSHLIFYFPTSRTVSQNKPLLFYATQSWIFYNSSRKWSKTTRHRAFLS
jgi:hypothetical protein